MSLVFVMATTLVCAVGCKQNSKPTHKHSYAATWSTDGTNHWHECECGDKIDLEAHKGGTATCTEKAECEVCRVKYGEVNANNHAGSEFNYVSNGNGTHKKTYECCGATAAESEACSGGTATCKEQATCEHCKAKYGNVSTDNHVSTEVKYVSKGNGKHDILYKCCDAVKEADVACSGGQATECGKKNVCKDCLTEYGEPLAHSWKTEYKSDGTQHWHECSRTGCTAISDKVNCAGGTATCTEKATCTTCGNEYGTALGHNYATTWSTDGTNHWHECSRCHDKKDLAAHSGGTATCTEQAECEVCHVKYGATLAHTEVVDAAVEATCTATGKTEGKHCSVCNKVLVEQTVVPAKGHNYVETEAAVEATYFEKGQKAKYHCEACQNDFYLDGETYVEITSETDLVIPYKTIISETTAAARDTSSTDLINEFVDSKVKECDDTVTNFVNIAKDGTTVKAAYFARTTSWAEKEDSAQNCGFIEVRIPVTGSILGVTFEYRLVDRNTDKCTYLATGDKAYGMKSYIEYKSSSLGYTNNSKEQLGDTAFVADGAWHKTNLYCAQDNMQNVLFKIYHLDGEFVITNLHLITSFADDAVTTTSPANDDLINNIVHLETEKKPSSNKIKNYDKDTPDYVTTTGINGEKVTALYFTKATAMTDEEDGSNYGFSEFRIAVSGKITKISFDYRLIDNNTQVCKTLTDTSDKSYGMKSFLEYKHHGTYTNETKAQYGDTFFDADGQWHHVEFTCEMEEMKAILFKIYHLQGEFMVTNVHADPAQHAHNWSTEWTTDGTDHWHACTGDGCNAKKDVADHTGGTATCTEQAECEVCHVKYGATLAHTEVVDAAVEATCTATGKTEGKHCSVCNKVLVEQTVVPAKGHNYVETEAAVEATYFEKGQKAKYHCEACQNDFYLDGETYVEITSETDLVIPYKTIISETTAAARDTSSTDLINEFVDSKVKECDDTVTNFVNIAKDGTTVKAAYFARTTSWAEKEDSAQNCGFIEVRIPVTGSILGVTFEYRLVDRNTDKCTYLATGDKAYGMKSYIEYKSSSLGYTNNSKEQLGDTAFVADGAWHKTNLYCAQDNMQNVLFKIYHLDGEFVITNLHLITSFAGDATATTIADDSTDLIKSIVHLDSSNKNKIKIYDQSEPNYVTTTGINGDTVTALYFTKIQGLTVADDYDEAANGTRTNKNNWGFSEFRITVSGNITKLSFDYRLVDSNNEVCETVYSGGVLADGNTAGVAKDKNMGMKSFLEYKSSTNGYNCRTLEKYGNTLFEADGQWHHIEFEYTEEGMQNILFKIYHLQGEFMVTNIQATMA